MDECKALPHAHHRLLRLPLLMLPLLRRRLYPGPDHSILFSST